MSEFNELNNSGWQQPSPPILVPVPSDQPGGATVYKPVSAQELRGLLLEGGPLAEGDISTQELGSLLADPASGTSETNDYPTGGVEGQLAVDYPSGYQAPSEEAEEEALPPKGVRVDGAKLRRVRQAQGLSIRALAQKAGVSPLTVQELETGKRNAYPATIGKLRKALGVRAEQFLK